MTSYGGLTRRSSSPASAVKRRPAKGSTFGMRKAHPFNTRLRSSGAMERLAILAPYSSSSPGGEHAFQPFPPSLLGHAGVVRVHWRYWLRRWRRPADADACADDCRCAGKRAESRTTAIGFTGGIAVAGDERGGY